MFWLILTLLLSVNAFWVPYPRVRVLSVASDPGIEDPDLKAFLSKTYIKPWGGTYDIMARRGQVPTPDMTPRDVCKVCLTALQNNDDPQLDHGAAVVLQFASPSGLLAEGGLDPAQYGRFLRDSEYSALIDFKTAEFVGEPQEVGDSLVAKQTVKVVGWDGQAPRLFNFMLSQVSGEQWLLDIILTNTSNEA